MRCLALLIGFCILTLVKGIGPSHDKIVVCLAYTDQVVESFNSTKIAKLEDIDLSLCTHLYAVHSSFHPERELWNSTAKRDEEELKQLKSLKLKYPHLKISLIMVSRFLTKYLNAPEHYDGVVKATTDYILQYGFDGLDISFEYDSKNPLNSFEFDRIVSMVKELGDSFRQSNLSLSSTFLYIDGKTDFYDYLSFSQHVDFISFAQSFFESKYDTLSYLNIFNVKRRINGLIQRGVPSEKILVDVNFMGYTFGKGNFDEFDNLMRYNEICKLTADSDEFKWEKEYKSDSDLVFLKNRDQNESIDEVVYESTRSLANRARLAITMNLGGVLTSAVNMDDFRGECPHDHETYNDFETDDKHKSFIPKHNYTTCPLLQTISDALYIAQYKLPPSKSADKFVCNQHCVIFIICCVVAVLVVAFLVVQSRNDYSFLGRRSGNCCRS